MDPPPPLDLLSLVQTVLTDFWDRLNGSHRWCYPSLRGTGVGAIDQQLSCLKAPIHLVVAIWPPRPGLEASGSTEHQRPGITGVHVFTGF